MLFDCDFSELTNVAAKLEGLTERCLTAAGHVVQKQIRDKTQNQSQSPNGTPFKPYTPRYAKYRTRHGRQSGRVDLTFTGELMRDVQPRMEGGILVVAPKESDLPRAEGLSKKRKFMGIAPETPDNVERAMVTAFESLFA